MAIVLPIEMMALICAQLLKKSDFKTLLSCALAGKELAVLALRCLYRYCAPYLDTVFTI